MLSNHWVRSWPRRLLRALASKRRPSSSWSTPPSSFCRRRTNLLRRARSSRAPARSSLPAQNCGRATKRKIVALNDKFKKYRISCRWLEDKSSISTRRARTTRKTIARATSPPTSRRPMRTGRASTSLTSASLIKLGIVFQKTRLTKLQVKTAMAKWARLWLMGTTGGITYSSPAPMTHALKTIARGGALSRLRPPRRALRMTRRSRARMARRCGLRQPQTSPSRGTPRGPYLGKEVLMEARN